MRPGRAVKMEPNQELIVPRVECDAPARMVFVFVIGYEMPLYKFCPMFQVRTLVHLEARVIAGSAKRSGIEPEPPATRSKIATSGSTVTRITNPS